MQRKCLNSTKKSGPTKIATGAFKTVSRRAIQKTAEVTGNKTPGTVAKSNNNVKIIRTNSSKTIQTENTSKIQKKKMQLGKRQQILDKINIGK